MSDLPWADSWKEGAWAELRRRRELRCEATKKRCVSEQATGAGLIGDKVKLSFLDFLETVKDIDAWISLPVQSMPSLGWLEFIVSFPGNMFGIPLFSMVLMPFVVAAIAEQMDPGNNGVAHWMSCAVVLMALIFWTKCCHESLKPGINLDLEGIVRAFQPFGKQLGTVATLGLPHASILATSLSSSAGFNAACYYVALYYVTQLVVEFFKATVRRERPVAKLKPRLSKVRRELPQIQRFLSHDHAIHSSFPSGDVSGATTFMFVACALTHTVSPHYEPLVACYVMVPVVSALCRLYFHAHFALDVVSGFAISASVFCVWTTRFDTARFSWSMLGWIEAIVIVLWALVQSLKPARAENIYNADGLGLGAARRLMKKIGGGPSPAVNKSN